jgi:triacylglycerol lipase
VGEVVRLEESHFEPFGFVASDQQGNAYVAFRGTMTGADEWNDFDFAQVAYALVNDPSFGYVASGFYSIYTTRLNSQIKSLRDSTNAAIGSFRPRNLYVTGHSLGAAICTLTVPDVVYNLSSLQLNAIALYNFASPRVGDPAFANAVNNSATKKLVALLFRMVNTEDAIPALPPAVSFEDLYEHIGTPISFSAQYGTDNPKAPQGQQAHS